MSAGYLLLLAVAVAVTVGTPLLLPGLSLRPLSVPLRATDAVLAGLGVLGLAFHCGAMFFRSVVEALPGSAAAISQVNALGTASIAWYVVPAVLLLVGLRRQHPVVLAVVLVALVAVGVTMYDGGPLAVHLAAIFASVVVLAGVAASLLPVPRRRAAANP
jgi:hypothetical protein